MIKNRESLLADLPEDELKARKTLLDIVDLVLERINPFRLVYDKLKDLDYSKHKHIYVIGAGKGASKMAQAVEELLKDRITEGFVIVSEDEDVDLKRIAYIHASHPLPNKNGVKGARKVLEIAQKAGENDLVISLISGGGSSLMPLPVDSVTLEEKIAATDLLLKSGADIHEINTVRKHLSQIKGGFLAKAVYPAKVINLVISDVLGDDLSIIASGPLSPDPHTFEDAAEVLKKYDLWKKVPASVHEYLGQAQIETPKPDEKIFEGIETFILANHETAAIEAEKACNDVDIKTVILDKCLSGECYKQAVIAVDTCRQKGCLHIMTGETTVNVKGDGCGGRNQEFVLAYLNEMKAEDHFAVLSIGTDGVDGFCPEKIAGAIASQSSLKAAEELSMQKYLDNNDSYNFFKEVKGLIKTGPTGTNLGDLILILT